MPNTFNILIIDDNAGMREVCRAVLTSAGHQVDVAEDGFTALLHLAERVPDLILCDLNMPQMSGFEFLSVIRRKFSGVRVVAMSGAYLGDSIPGGVLADAFYSKGQSPKTFLETINVVLQSPVPSRHSRELAEVWFPLNAMKAGYVVLTCPECFRTFPLTLKVVSSPEVLTVPCFFCAYEVKYRNDWSRLMNTTGGSDTTLGKLAKAENATLALEDSAGAFNGEIASQMPLI
jgi:CheY-like chemotaxis protein